VTILYEDIVDLPIKEWISMTLICKNGYKILLTDIYDDQNIGHNGVNSDGKGLCRS
jgi:hypothetical protein